MKPKDIKKSEKDCSTDPISVAACTNTTDQPFYQIPINPPMTEQTVVPPPYVWNRIEKILDQQDRDKALVENAQTPSIRACKMQPKKKVRAIFTVLGVSLLACCMFYLY